jgi:hypothetical protein
MCRVFASERDPESPERYRLDGKRDIEVAAPDVEPRVEPMRRYSQIGNLVTVSVAIVLLNACATTEHRGTRADLPTHDAPPTKAPVADVEPALTNEDVIKLSRMGLGDDVVISKVRAARRVRFDLGVADLQGLRDAKVSSKIIAVMLDRTSPATAANPTAFSPEGQTWLLTDGQPVELRGVAGYVEASIGQAFKQAFLMSFSNKMAVIARGPGARFHASQGLRVVYTRHNPSELGIVRFTVQADRQRRYVWVVSRVGSTEGEFYPPEDNVLFDEEPVSRDLHKLTLRRTLEAGEYGLVAPGGTTGYLIYDFAVD